MKVKKAVNQAASTLGKKSAQKRFAGLTKAQISARMKEIRAGKKQNLKK